MRNLGRIETLTPASLSVPSCRRLRPAGGETLLNPVRKRSAWRRCVHRVPFLAATVLLSALGAWAAQVAIEPTADNTIYEDDGSLSCGSGESLIAGNRAFPIDPRRAVMRFSLADSIPAGSTIVSVTLNLSLLQTIDLNSRNMSLHRLLADWGEGSSDCDGPVSNGPGVGRPAEAGDATWTHRFYDTATWASAGGDFEAVASATTLVGDQGNAYGWSGAGLVADVQGWLDNPATDFGWILIGNEAVDTTARRFGSRENTQTGDRPLLVVDFAPPASATPGEALDLRVSDVTPGVMTLSYQPACGSPQHTIVYGPLSAVSSYGYSGQVCDIGASGSYSTFNPGPGSFFFLVVGHDASDVEGSYGLRSSGAERPEDTFDPTCSLTQDLSQRCD